MSNTELVSRHGLQQLCPLHSSLANCLNQLRQAKIMFLNLGNLIVCPEQRCYFIFNAKQLIRIEPIYS